MGAYISLDGGLTWSPAKIRSDGNSMATAAAFDPQNKKIIYVGGQDGGSRACLHKSTNGGASWTQLAIPAGFDLLCLAVDPKASGTLYFGGGSGVFKSTNGGSSWTQLTGVYNAQSMAVNPKDGNEVFVGNWSGVFYSKDQGATWKDFSQGLPVKITTWVAVHPTSRIVYAGTFNGGLLKRNF
jgi:photosystem II stability/assembly factor-like uncharacterized protein